MKKINIVRHNRDFSNIINNGKKYSNNVFSLYIKDRDENNHRIGISVSKKIGNAVVRNKIKRQMRTICDKYKKNYKNERDYIIIIRRNYIDYSFEKIEEKYVDIINKSNQYEGDH